MAQLRCSTPSRNSLLCSRSVMGEFPKTSPKLIRNHGFPIDYLARPQPHRVISDKRPSPSSNKPPISERTLLDHDHCRLLRHWRRWGTAEHRRIGKLIAGQPRLSTVRFGIIPRRAHGRLRFSCVILRRGASYIERRTYSRERRGYR